MVGVKQLSLVALLWAGLASRGVALEIDQNTNDLTFVERSEALGEVPVLDTRTLSIQIVPYPSKHAREFDELDERDFDELDERDLEGLVERDLEELDERDLDEMDERDLEELDERDIDEMEERGLETRLRRAAPLHKATQRPRSLQRAKHLRAYTRSEELEARNTPGKHRPSWGNKGGRGPRHSGPRTQRPVS